MQGRGKQYDQDIRGRMEFSISKLEARGNIYDKLCRFSLNKLTGDSSSTEYRSKERRDLIVLSRIFETSMQFNSGD
ncbi:hypothetical protein M5689_015647 [Euphorbia peplus]|nr:hypothetical protein M5689_015647 [Euphorbia peplus]